MYRHPDRMLRCYPALLLLLTLGTRTLSAQPYPVTEEIPVKSILHGQEDVDPYRWLEGSAAPEAAADPHVDASALDAKVQAWTKTQSAFTRSVLDRLTGREQLTRRLSELRSSNWTEAPQVREKRLFYRRRQGTAAQRVLYFRAGHADAERLLLDPNTLDPTGLTTIEWYEPSHDGRLLAFGLYHGGDENSTLHLLRVDDGLWLADEIPLRVEAAVWLPDGSGFFYRCLAALGQPYSGQVRFHRVGRHYRQDPVVFEQYKEGPLATTWGPEIYGDAAGRWLVLRYATGTDANDLWVYDLERFQASGELVRSDVLLGERADSGGPVVGDTLFLRTTLDALNGRVFAVDLRRPQRANWRLLIPERKDQAIERVIVAQGQLLVEYLAQAANRIERFDFTGQPLGAIELPGLGTASVTARPDQSEVYLSYESFNQPGSIYRLDLISGARELWWQSNLPVNPDTIAVEQVFYRSFDGTEVSMFLVHSKDMVLDGKRPTLLTGYGGFSIARKPEFSSRDYTWIEAGGLYALPNLRGGGEYGEAWHRAGMLEKKPNVFADFIAAAEWLIARGYTRPEHLGIVGGSNGGLLTGAALVQRPELFSAVISAVPLLDMLRYQYFLMARFWVPEYGSAEDPSQFPFLLRYSPYHNVKPGVAYPAVLLTAAENDTRVHALHARKMAARLQKLTRSDPRKEPILLWVEQEAGHGPGKPLALQVQNDVDQLSFLAWQLGLFPAAN